MLHALTQALRKLNQPIAAEQLRALLASINLTIEDVRPYLHLDPVTYARNGVYRGDGFEVLVFCWQSGQKSPIHDHAGSACGVRVVSGSASETTFERVKADSDRVIPIGRSDLRTGQVTASFDSDIHMVANDDPGGELLVTLHVYSPPLKVMNTYEILEVSEMDACAR